MVGKINPRYGVEVYVGDLFDVCVKQERDSQQDDHVIILHRDEAKDLIALLQAAISESEEIERQEAENA